jgi:CelD/BcsL family acetyltransferase involved in cellulose biosynthesis
VPTFVRFWRGLRVLEWAAQEFSDYCDGVGEPGAVSWILDRVLSSSEFDLIRLKNIRRDALVYPFLVGRGYPVGGSERCLGLRCLWPDGESWFATLNKKKRNNHRRGLRILSDTGEVVFRLMSAEERWDEVVAQLIALKREWLRANRFRSQLLHGNTFPPFVEALHRMGRLRIFVLESNGKLVAGSVNALHHKELLAFFAAYDPAYERSSPGILLMNEMAKWAFGSGIRYLDYLRGEEPYKFEFANDQVDLTHFVASRTFLGRSARLAHQLMAGRRTNTTSTEIGTAYFTANGTPRQVH